MKPALLIIDVQKAFFGPNTAPSLNTAIQQINAAVALFREQELPIFCIQQMEPAEQLMPGETGFDVPDDLAVLPSDQHIHKRYENSFNKTPLSEKLRQLDVDTVIVTGFCAEYCVLGTYRGAKDLDLKAFILRDAIASGTPENIGFVESISRVIPLEDLRKALA